MDPIELMKLIALLLCVPTQLWLSQTTAPANNGRVGERIDWKGGGHGLMDIEGRFQNGIHMLGAPYRLYKRIMHIEKNDYGPKLQPSGAQPKSPAVEVIKASYFAASRRIRRDRRKLSYRVGQVFVHKKHGYKGLIIGWDSAARAPAAWFKDNHVSVKQRQQPWYAVLVDSGDRDEAYSRTYVMEENIQIVSDQAEVQAFHHSDTSDYFVGYDAHMQRWEPTERLRRRYPED
eukprot:m.141300 g.141300  ORF g.141300 m.141300 type:complete len:232 (-) comp17669_c0_seq1:148-843(-)